MQHGGYHDGHFDALDFFAHAPLGFLHIVDDARHRTIVADRACQHHGDVARESFIGDTFTQQACLHSDFQGASGTDGIDSTKVIAMTTLDLFATVQIDAQGGAKKGRFNIVGDDGITSENNLHIASANQVSNVSTSSGMNDGRTKHKEDFAVASAGLLHLVGNFVNSQHFDLFRGDTALHKSEGLTLTRTFKGLDTDAIMTGDNLVANLYFVHRHAVGAASGAVNNNGHIHLDTLNVNPLPMQAYLGRQVGGRVEFCREDTLLLNNHRLNVVDVHKDGTKLL